MGVSNDLQTQKNRKAKRCYIPSNASDDPPLMTSLVKESFENVASKRSVKTAVASAAVPEERISPTTTN